MSTQHKAERSFSSHRNLNTLSVRAQSIHGFKICCGKCTRTSTDNTTTNLHTAATTAIFLCFLKQEHCKSLREKPTRLFSKSPEFTHGMHTLHSTINSREYSHENNTSIAHMSSHRTRHTVCTLTQRPTYKFNIKVRAHSVIPHNPHTHP